MVAMASDSYLLKAPQPPCGGQASRRGSARPATSCGVVVTLVLLVGAVLLLAALAYHQYVALVLLRAEVSSLAYRLEEAEQKGLRVGSDAEFASSEVADWLRGTDQDESDDFWDGDGDSDQVDDDSDLVYLDPEDTNIFENRARGSAAEGGATVPRLEPAGSLQSTAPAAPAAPTATPSAALPPARAAEAHDDVDEDLMAEIPSSADGEGARDAPHRRRREVPSASARLGRPTPQLRLYKTLLEPVRLGDEGPAPRGQQWSSLGARPAQYAYMEEAPAAFVTPPRRLGTTPSPPPAIASRRSRVMGEAAEVYGPHRSRHQASRNYQRQQQQQAWQRQDAESIDNVEEEQALRRPCSPAVEGPAIAAHFAANASSHLSHGTEHGGHHAHANGEYPDWAPSSWVQQLGLGHHFSNAEHRSAVLVRTTGLYLVYAQVNYYNDMEENGFWLYRNRDRELMCVVTAPAADPAAGRRIRANTCFTAGVLHLAAGDRVAVRDLKGERVRVLNHAGRTFIGLVNLSACKLKA